MNESNAPEHAYLQRQIAFLHEQGQAPEEIDKRLAQFSQGASVAEIVQSADVPDVFVPHLIKHIEDSDQRATALVEYQAFKQELMELTASARGLLGGVTLYVAVLALVVLALLAAMMTFVLPNMEALYRSVGADLPALTVAIYSVGSGAKGFVGVLLVLAPFVMLGWLLKSTRDGKAAMSMRRVPDRRSARWQLRQNLVRYQLRLMKLWLVRLYCDQGEDLAGSWTHAESTLADYAGADWDEPGGRLREQLATSEAIGTLTEEIAFQIRQALQAYPSVMSRYHVLVRSVVYLVLGLVVGLVVIGTYLPMFKLGATL